MCLLMKFSPLHFKFLLKQMSQAVETIVSKTDNKSFGSLLTRFLMAECLFNGESFKSGDRLLEKIFCAVSNFKGSKFCF